MSGNIFQKTAFQNMAFSSTNFGNKSDLELKRSFALFDASKIPLADGANVSEWRELFGRETATQGTVANQPTFDADGLNGKPCVVFDGTGDYMNTGILSDTEDCTFFFAGQTTSAETAEKCITGTGNSSTTRSIFLFKDGYFSHYVGDLSAATAKSTTRVGYNMTPFVGCVVRESKTVKIRVNGVEEYSGTYGGTGITNYECRMNAYNYRNGSPNLFLKSKNSAMVFTKHAMTLPEIEIMENALAQKIGIDIHTKYKVIIVAGQSNTHRGSGLDPTGLDAYPSGVYQYGRAENETYPALSGREGEIFQAIEPLDHCTPDATRGGFTNAFVKKYIQEQSPTDPILIIPCGYQGTSFQAGYWGIGNTGYNDVVSRANDVFTRFPNSTLEAILWHQGEADVGNAGYQNSLDAQFNAWRGGSILKASATTPIILGEMCPDWVELDADRIATQAIINDTPNRLANTAVASGDGLTDHSTGYYHYTMVDHRTFGQRYYDAYASLLP